MSGHEMNLVPWPKEVEPGFGKLELTPGTRIVPVTEELRPLADVLAEEITRVGGLQLSTGDETGRPGDIVLRPDDQLAGEEYRVSVTDRVQISGATYQAIASGTSTLVQALETENGAVHLPRLRLRDEPAFAYRGLMIDVARHWHSIDTLRQVVRLARFYKTRYLQLHLTDDESFTIPCAAFPELPTPDRHYTVEELRDLEHFATVRGVVIVPEVDVPGHSAPMRKIAPFSVPGRELIDMASDAVYDALDRIVGEVCGVFPASPYFHIGADESNLRDVGSTEREQSYMRRHGLAEGRDLYLHFVVRMNEIVVKHGKQTMLWEGFSGTGSDCVEIPREILVFAWETLYELPQNLLNNGYTVINSTWKPLYVANDRCWSSESIYGWNPHRWENWSKDAPSYVPIQLKPHDRVIGAQMCAWEQPEERELESLRPRLPAMSERIWNPEVGLGYADFARRWVAADARLQRLL